MERCKRSVVVAAALVFSLLCAVGLAQEPKPLPPDCVGFVHTESLGTLTQNANGFIGAVMPGMNAQLLTIQLGAQIKNPALLGVDQSRPMSLVLLNPKTFPEWAVLLIPLTDGVQFLQGTAQMAKDMGEVEGIHTLAASEFDQAAFQRATPEQKQNIQQFMIQRNFYVAICDKTAVFSKEQTGCAAVKKWLAEGLLDISKSATVKGDIVACANVKALMDIYAPEIDQRVAPFLATLEQAVQAAQAANPEAASVNPAAVAKITKLEVDALVSLAKQLETVEIGLDLRPEGARLRLVLVAKPETPAVRFIAAQKLGKPELVRFIPANAPVVGEVNLVTTPELMDFYVSLMDSIYALSGTPMDPAEKERHLNLIKEAVKLYTGNLALGLLMPGEGQVGYTIVCVRKCTDAAREKQLFAENLSPQGPVMKLYDALGLKFALKQTEKVEVFEGVEVSEVELDMSLQSREAVEAIDRIYGHPMKMRYGVTGDKFLLSFGKNAGDGLHQLITLANKGGGDVLESANIKSALASFPPALSGFVVVVPGPLIGPVGEKPAPGEAPAPAPGAEPAAARPPTTVTGALGAYAVMSDRVIRGELVVPMDLVLSIKDAVMMGALGGTPGGRRGMRMPPPGAPGAPAPGPQAPQAPAPAPAPKPAPPAQP